MPGPRLLLGLLAALPAHAGPTGPFPDCGPDDRDACPVELGWTDWSWIPEGSVDTVRADERDLGSGVGLDRALRTASGRWEVTVAVLDSGIDWADRQAADKVRLNAGELPAPLGADGAPVPDGDLDGNGILDIRDYAEDPRLDPEAGVDRADTHLDPSDLIATFSDGVDDDGNGYVDDIAGWDFFEHDNDPDASYEVGYWDHGTGVMRSAAAWADDGGSLGACPDCSILPIRVGEAFITDGDRVALALGFAADHGVASAALAIGGLSPPEAADAVAAHAADAGVVLVGAAGDENTWHRNQPAVADPFLFVKSVRALDRNERGGARTYLATWHCNNVGPRLDVVAPASACATGAVARIAGLAGLLTDATLRAGLEPDAATLRSLLRATATDVAFSEAESAELALLPAREGWDAFHGYGRVDIGAAVDALRDGPPPTADLTGPAWFAFAEGPVEVRGRVDGAGVGWVLEHGLGPEPDAWTEVARGDGPAEGILATVELPTPQVAPPRLLSRDDTFLDRFARAHEPLVQLRLRVTDDLGATAEDRTGVWVHDDPDRLPGFPLRLGGSLDSAPNLADLDGDGVFEILQASASGAVHALDGAGVPLPGWPAFTETHPHVPDSATWRAVPPLREGLLATPAVGDLDGDGRPEVVVAGLAGRIYAWHADGRLVDGFPRDLSTRQRPLPPAHAWDPAILGSPALVDVDGDGDLEIVQGTGEQQLWVLDGDGTPLSGSPLDLCDPDTCGETGARILAPPAVGDVDGDGDPDAIIATGEVPPGAAGVVHQIDLRTGAVVRSLRRTGLLNDTLLPVIGEGHPAPVALTDLDGDGDLEISSAPMLSAAAPLHHDDTEALPLQYGAASHGLAATYTGAVSVQMIHAPAWGDVDGDGIDDLVVGVASADYLVSLAQTRTVPHQHGVFAWSGATGVSLPGFPQQVDSVAFLTAPALADVDGDDDVDVLFTSSGHWLYAVDAEGEPAAGFPRFHGGWAMGGPVVGDITGDGRREVILATREGLLFAWRTEAPADGPAQWPRPRHDPALTGDATTALPVQAGPPVGEEREGCGCASPGAGASWLALLGGLLLVRRRRA